MKSAPPSNQKTPPKKGNKKQELVCSKLGDRTKLVRSLSASITSQNLFIDHSNYVQMLPTNYIAAVYANLKKLGLEEEKEQLVSQFTNERTTSVRNMKIREARVLLQSLQTSADQKATQKRVKMINTIYSLAYQMNITLLSGENIKVDTTRLNELIKALSPQKKSLQAHNNKELTILVTIVKKYYNEGLKKGGFYESTGA